MTLRIVTWVWGDKYPDLYIHRLLNGIARNISDGASIFVMGPQPEDIHLTTIPGCFCRLRMFDPEWQARIGAEPGDRLVCLDLDLIVTGGLDEVFDRPEPFVILQGVNAANPNPYNGSVWMLRSGYRPDVWNDFSLEAARKVPWYAFPDDQAWMHHKIPDAAAFGPETGVYAFQKPGWPDGMDMPHNARVVAFPGKRDPSQFTHLPWVRHHWS
jgi:hypothetical protein